MRIGNTLFRYRDALFPIALLTAAFSVRPRLAGGDLRTDAIVDAVGFLISATGQALRIAVVGLAYITRGGQNRQVWANSLQDRGVFAHCRNPLYVGNFLVIAGLAVVHNGWTMWAMVPLFVLGYMAIVAAEEAYLLGRFGDAYTGYCRRVPRWIPSLRGLRGTLTGSRFDWLKVLRKEYGTLFAWPSGFLLLLVWEQQTTGAPLASSRNITILIVWIAMAAAYLRVRYLKLSGGLGHD